MSRYRAVNLSALIALGAIALPFIANDTSIAATRSSETSSVGTQLATLNAPDAVLGDNFGASVSISGSTAIVGADGHAKAAGVAYVFTKSASGWQQTAELKGSDTVAGDRFGSSVAISGSTAIVGADARANNAGVAYVFTKSASGWHQTAELKGSDTAKGNDFGVSVGISGSYAIVGSLAYLGRAYVFAPSATGWHQVAQFKGSSAQTGLNFGSSVSISGTTAVVGALGANRAYVYTKSNSGWPMAATLKGNGVTTGDFFGVSVSVSGSTAIVGALGKSGNAYVFSGTSGWRQVAKLKGTGTVSGDNYGSAVAVSDTTAVVGALGINRAFIYENGASGWRQVAELKGSAAVVGDYFGVAVAVSGSTALTGASGRSTHKDLAYLFKA